jgi:endoglycosylceramidase
MPRWICEGAFYEDWPYPINILAASGDWWRRHEYQDGFNAAWDLVSDFFAGDDRIWAYDLFNEPMAGVRTLPWFFENPILRPFYERLIQTIRANDPDKWIFIEPAIIHVAGFPFVMDPLPYERLIYSPHLYPWEAANGGGYVFGPDLIRRDVRHARTEANRFGAPLFIGETGMVSGAAGADLFTRDTTAILDDFLAHWTWWCYHKDDNQFGLVDRDGNDKETYHPYLARPYARATMGRVGAMSFDPEDALFELGFANAEGGDPDTRIWLPPRYYDAGFSVTCSDPEGTWGYDYDPATRELFVEADPASAWHVVTVRPAP